MFVRDYMTRHPIMIEPEVKVIEAQKLMADNKIRHLPVVGDGKRLLGLVTRTRLQIPPGHFGSLNVWEVTRMLSDLKVKDVMVKGSDMKTIGPSDIIENAAHMMITHKIGGLPVVEDGVVVGVITETDLLIELENLLGAFETGWRVTMRVPDRDGEVARFSQAVLNAGWGIMAMGSVRTPRQDDSWDLVAKISCTAEKDTLLETLGQIEGQEVLDIRQAVVRS